MRACSNEYNPKQSGPVSEPSEGVVFVHEFFRGRTPYEVARFELSVGTLGPVAKWKEWAGLGGEATKVSG
jgi:hypothetical protein